MFSLGEKVKIVGTRFKSCSHLQLIGHGTGEREDGWGSVTIRNTDVPKELLCHLNCLLHDGRRCRQCLPLPLGDYKVKQGPKKGNEENKEALKALVGHISVLPVPVWSPLISRNSLPYLNETRRYPWYLTFTFVILMQEKYTSIVLSPVFSFSSLVFP